MSMFNRMVEHTQESLNRVFSAVADHRNLVPCNSPQLKPVKIVPPVKQICWRLLNLWPIDDLRCYRRARDCGIVICHMECCRKSPCGTSRSLFKTTLSKGRNYTMCSIHRGALQYVICRKG